jgi:hypothetical protein
MVFFALAADPLRPSAEGARPDDSRPLTSFVARRRRRGISFPCRRWSPPDLRRVRPPYRSARAACRPRWFRAREQNDPRRLPSAWPRDLATAVDSMTRTCPSALLPFRHRFACCDEARRRPTTRASASRYSANHERLSRGRLRGPCGRRPHRERRRCSSPTSATDLRHVHLLSIARFPVCSVHFRSPLTIQRSHLRRTRRAGSHLTMRSALRSIRRSRVPPSGGRGHP